MRSPPDGLTERALVRVIAERWGIELASVRYEAVGFGSHHWSGIGRDSQRWFVTVDDLNAKRRSDEESLDASLSRLRAALGAARAARDASLAFVVAPVPNLDGGVVEAVGEEFAVAVYPWIEGRTHPYGAYPSLEARLDVVRLIVDLHTAAAEVRAGAPSDDLLIPCRGDLVSALGALDVTWDGGPYGEPTRAALGPRASRVERLLARYDVLARWARRRPERCVLTHGEPHVANVIQTDEGLMLVDWDTTLVALPERDLWMLETGDGAVLRAYTEATGVAVDADALELYRLWWDLTEIATYVRLFRRPHRKDADADESFENLLYYVDVEQRWPSLA